MLAGTCTWEEGNRPQGQALAGRVTHLRCGGGQGRLAQAL
jgi:hypothetical protein